MDTSQFSPVLLLGQAFGRDTGHQARPLHSIIAKTAKVTQTRRPPKSLRTWESNVDPALSYVYDERLRFGTVHRFHDGKWTPETFESEEQRDHFETLFKALSTFHREHLSIHQPGSSPGLPSQARLETTVSFTATDNGSPPLTDVRSVTITVTALLPQGACLSCQVSNFVLANLWWVVGGTLAGFILAWSASRLRLRFRVTVSENSEN